MDSIRDRGFRESIKNCRIFRFSRRTLVRGVNFVFCCILTKISMRLFSERYYYSLLHTKALLLHLKVIEIVAYTLKKHCSTSVLISALSMFKDYNLSEVV